MYIIILKLNLLYLSIYNLQVVMSGKKRERQQFTEISDEVNFCF